ncbi:MAG: hypothetical protein AAGI17_09680 [Planctomycetota bacterium]
MPHRKAFHLYQRKRVVNINVNVIVAGVVSTVIVAKLVWMLRDGFDLHWPTWGFTIFSVGADIVLDVALFTALHWIANHWRPLKARSVEEQRQLHAESPDTVKDTAQVQIERAIISPLYYVLAAGGTESLQRVGLHPSWAIIVGYVVALAVTRTIHTYWGLQSGTYHDHHIREKKARIERRKRKRAEQEQEREQEHSHSEPS